MMKNLLSVTVLLAAVSTANAATYYVDSAATGANNGSSWANAWTSMGAISGVKGGDTVYISGGPSGSSRTYSIGSGFPVVSGSSASAIVTYQIGQDSAHNGTATFSGSGTFLNGSPNYFAIVGDAGDGNMHFATSGFSIIEWSSSQQNNIRIGYVNFGNMAGSGGQNGNIMYMAPVNGLEFDHNYVYASAPDANAFAFIRCSGSTWDQNKIHHNSLFLPHASGAPGEGADGIEMGGTSGVSFYNNTVTAYATGYTGGQHQDGWQDTGGSSYIKVYNNKFINFGNYCVYGDATFGDFTHFWIYNNVAIITDSAVQNGSPGAFVVGVDGGYSGSATFTDVVIANNLTDSYLNNQGISLNNVSSHGASFVSCVVANNLSVNGGGISLQGNSSSATPGNISLSTSQAAQTFKTYAANSANNDYHLLSTGTSVIGVGGNYYSDFTTDMAGSARASSGAWDSGPYAYGSTGGGGTTNPTPTLTLTAISQNASDVDAATAGMQVYEGTIVQYSATATETGGKTVSWAWSYQINGGASVAYSSGTGTVTPVSFNYTTGQGGNTYVWTLTANDGTTALSAQITTGVEVPPAPQTGLTFTASQGTITAPFTLANGSVSQSVQTTVVSQAGEAAFNFAITNAGNYVIQAAVNAPNDAANSMFVNIDAQPVDPTMIWDIVLTTNFQQRIVSWRGNGTDTANQFVPKVFNLGVGNHQIIFAGREANVQLQGFSLLQLPNSPQNLRVLPTVVNAPTFSAGP